MNQTASTRNLALHFYWLFDLDNSLTSLSLSPHL